MANPQKEKGFTGIANELIEIMYRFKFNATQYKILLCLIRYTYGFNRKHHQLSIGFFSKATGVSRRYISSELNKLIDAKVVKLVQKHSDTESRVLSFNKNYEEWIGYCDFNQQMKNCATDEELFNTTDEELFNTTDEEFFNQEIQNKEIIKESIYTDLLNHWNAKKIIQHRPTKSLINQIKLACKKFGQYNIIKSIDNYSVVYNDPNYYYSHIWRLDKFLKQSNGIPDFLDEGQQWINYSKNTLTQDRVIDNIYNLNGR